MTEFRASRRTGLFLVRNRLLVLAMFVGAIIAALIAGIDSPVPVFLAGLGALALAADIAVRRRVASRIEVSAEGLSARTFSGADTYIRWGEVAAFESVSAPTFGGHHRTAVLSTQGQKVIFTDLISGYEQLVQMIRDKAPSAEERPALTRLERLLLVA